MNVWNKKAAEITSTLKFAVFDFSQTEISPQEVN